MRVLLLTSREPRHLSLARKLLDNGHEVLVWAEEKGDNLNTREFGDASQLLDLHRDSLSSALLINFPNDKQNHELPIVFHHRGAFRNSDLLEAVNNYAPDVLVTYGCGIVGQALIEWTDGDILGSHQGLPHYFRGSGSNFFAFVSGCASHMGISLHLIDRGVDTGPVIKQLAPAPNPEDSYYTYSARLVIATQDLYMQTLHQIQNRTFEVVHKNARPLATLGKWYQRKDFTPDILRKCMLMQLDRSFAGWYSKSIQRHGAPVLF